GADGAYRFDGLPPGTYTIVVRDGTDRFSGFRATLDPDGTLDGETDASLAVSQDRTGLDFAYRGAGSVGDTIWSDTDGDGALDPSEDPIAGIVVDLVWAGFDGVLGSADDVLFPSQTTGPDGVYLFDGVPAGLVDVSVDEGSVDDDLEPTTSTSYTYDLDPGEDYLDGDIGYRAREELPNTGFDADRLGFLSLGMMGLGLALLFVGRRRRRHEQLHWERLA
ncbi:MAG: LPXTG cell wall anchor domain-containing protein, partial [Acidimicrobiia bacterium]|nr:LPXTG cell wall anchor domain-containing protein [Acidimicrobiia bacterium]